MSCRAWQVTSVSSEVAAEAGLLKFLREDGVPEEALRRIRVPIGLDLGGKCAKIALAILAEVVSARYGGSHLPLSQQRQDAGKDVPP